MSARKFVQSAYLDSSAFIPLIDASNSLHNKIVNHLKEMQLFPGIDTVVLSEVLAGVDESVDRDELVETYTRQFRVPSFDAQAAKVSAEIFSLGRDSAVRAKGRGSAASENDETERQLPRTGAAVGCAIYRVRRSIVYNRTLARGACSVLFDFRLASVVQWCCFRGYEYDVGGLDFQR